MASVKESPVHSLVAAITMLHPPPRMQVGYDSNLLNVLFCLPTKVKDVLNTVLFERGGLPAGVKKMRMEAAQQRKRQ